MTGPLVDVRVIEICDQPGQYAGKLLADMGADVIKVETPAGSSARAIGPFVRDIPGPNRSLNFWYYNTNKRSVVLDWENSADGKAALLRLIDGADLVLEDRAPGELASLGIDLAALRAVQPDLITCSITPFGQDGPWAQYKTSDMVSLAVGGPMNMNGYSEGDAPPNTPPIHGKGDQGYNTACHFALHGILAALFHRDRTGQGQAVDCSIHEALSSTTEVGLPYWLYHRVNVIRQTGRHAAGTVTEPWYFPTKDGKGVILYGIGRDNSSWAKLVKWFQEEGFGAEFSHERFASVRDRQPGRGSAVAAEISAEVARFMAAHTAEEIYRGGQTRDQAWGVVRTPEETLTDGHWEDRGFFVEVVGEGVDAPVKMPGAPYSFSATPWELRRPAPRLGEHTEEVLAEIW